MAGDRFSIVFARRRAVGLVSKSHRSPARFPRTSVPTEIAVRAWPPRSSRGAPTWVLIAMSDGAWGTPRHLRGTRAARWGWRTPGAADAGVVVIVCSVGDPSKNHSRAEDSAANSAPAISPASPG